MIQPSVVPDSEATSPTFETEAIRVRLQSSVDDASVNAAQIGRPDTLMRNAYTTSSARRALLTSLGGACGWPEGDRVL